MENKQIEFAGFGPKSYIEAAKRAGAEALVVELNRERVTDGAEKLRRLEAALKRIEV
jgi:ABC-type phosphate/phosphonate transport system substrate-binding protein